MERMVEPMYRRVMQRTVMVHSSVPAQFAQYETCRSHRVNKEVYNSVYLLVNLYVY
jgi:hypothetical protein